MQCAVHSKTPSACSGGTGSGSGSRGSSSESGSEWAWWCNLTRQSEVLRHSALPCEITLALARSEVLVWGGGGARKQHKQVITSSQYITHWKRLLNVLYYSWLHKVFVFMWTSSHWTLMQKTHQFKSFHHLSQNVPNAQVTMTSSK